MNYIKIGEAKIELTDEQVAEFKRQMEEKTELSAIGPGGEFELAGYEFIVLEQLEN